jgi:beta-barrel assembly-enhancing protease
MRSVPHKLSTRLTVLLSTAALTLASSFAASSLAVAQDEADLPDMGNPAGTILSRSDEYSVGLMVMKELRDQKAIIDDPESTEYIQSLGGRIAAQVPEGSGRFTYSVVDDSSINAFAVPGGFIFMNYGTIIATDNESELAGVLAHETAHVVQRHIARAIQAESKQSILTAAAILASILIGAAGGGGQAIEGGIAAAQGLAIQQQINYTRTQEWEADRVGMGFLSRAGFDPDGMPDFFETFGRRYGYGESLYPKFLINHPVTPDRIAEGRARAAQLDHPKHIVDSTGYALIRERLRVMTAAEDADVFGYYQRRIDSGEATLAEKYGMAVAMTQRRRPAEAVDLLRPLVAQHPDLILLHTALAQAQVAAGHMDEGLATFAHAEELFPRNVPLCVRYGEALIKAGHPKQAHLMLLDLFNNVDPTPPQIQLTAQAASAAGDEGDAYYYMGEYQIENGNLGLAQRELEMALGAPHLTTVQRERYKARLDEIRQFLANNRRAARQAQVDGGR